MVGMPRRWPALLLAVALATLAACSPAGGGSSSAGPAQGPTPVPEPPEVTDLPGRGVQILGHGTTQTDDITPQYGGGLTIGIDVVTLTHDGHSSFIVTATQGDQSEHLASAIGSYQGQRPLVVEGPVSFQVTADGNWTLKVQPMANGGEPAFSGSGDAVSPYFTPPNTATWSISHDGKTTFFVYAHCVGGSLVVEDRTGAVQDTAQVQFPRGPCFWEVRADGAWTMQPQT
jgi:hypothetical protein